MEPILTVRTGQRRIPNAERFHVWQYLNNPPPPREDDRVAIRRELGIAGANDNEIGERDVQATQMFIWCGRSDIATMLWRQPAAFREQHADLFALALDRRSVNLVPHLIREEDQTRIKKQWQDSLDSFVCK
jgi:hypothetical protein